MELIYKSETIENILNALNQLQISGVNNMKIITYVVQEINQNRSAEKKE